MLKKISKKGTILTVNELIPFVLAIAIVILLVFLTVNLFVNWDVGKKTSESSLDALKLGVAEAEEAGGGSYFLLDGKRDDGLNYYLAYFGEKATFNDLDKDFVYLGKNSNRICVCYEETKDMYCIYCINLLYPAKLDGREGPWAAESNQNIKIKLNGEVYEFSIQK